MFGTWPAWRVPAEFSTAFFACCCSRGGNRDSAAVAVSGAVVYATGRNFWLGPALFLIIALLIGASASRLRCPSLARYTRVNPRIAVTRIALGSGSGTVFVPLLLVS